jgi:hypothetical protein
MPRLRTGCPANRGSFHPSSREGDHDLVSGAGRAGQFERFPDIREGDGVADSGLLTTLTLAGPGPSDPARLSLSADTAKEVVHQCVNKLMGERLIRQ